MYVTECALFLSFPCVRDVQRGRPPALQVISLVVYDSTQRYKWEINPGHG